MTTHHGGYDPNLLMADLKRDEGIRLKPYVDTVGKVTIGIGRNLTDVGITPEEAENLCWLDVDRAQQALDANIPWWQTMSEPRQRALLNMCFQLGWHGLSQFKTTLGHLQAERYIEAADSALQSLWARQVPQRAKRVTDLLRNG